MLIGVLALATALRFWALGQREVWYDEAFSVLYAEKGLSDILYGTISQVEGAAADVHPPLYYFLLHAWMVLGESPFVARALSAFLGITTVAVSYALGEELFDRRAGLMGAFVVAISPFHVYYSQEARMYSLLAFLLVLGTYFFVRAVRTPRFRHWLGFSVCFALAQYTHNVAVFWLLALDAYALLAHFRGLRLLKQVALANAGVAMLYAPWLLVLPGQISKMEQAYWIPVPGLVELVRLIIAVTLNLPAPPVLLPLWVFFAFSLLALVTRFTIARLKRDVYAQGGLVLLLFVLVLPVAVTFLVSQVRPVFIERIFVASQVAYCLLIGWAVSRARLSGGTLLWAAPALAIVGLSLQYQYTYDQFPRPPYHSAVKYLRANYDASSVIIHSSKLSFFPSYYWDRSLPQHFLPDVPGSPQDTLARPTMQVLNIFPDELEELAKGRETVYFVVFRKALDEAQGLGKPLPDLAWLEDRFEPRDVVSFNDLYVYVLDRKDSGEIASRRVR